MKPLNQYEGAPQILAYRTDESDGAVAFHITRQSRGIDVFTTLAYLNPNRGRLYKHAEEILRHAVNGLGLLNNIHLPIPRTSIKLSDQITLMEHVHFGSNTTVDDVTLAIEIVSGVDQVEIEKFKLTSAIIDTGCLAGYVIDTVQRNEFVTATDEDLQNELMTLTENHYDL